MCSSWTLSETSAMHSSELQELQDVSKLVAPTKDLGGKLEGLSKTTGPTIAIVNQLEGGTCVMSGIGSCILCTCVLLGLNSELHKFLFIQVM